MIASKDVSQSRSRTLTVVATALHNRAVLAMVDRVVEVVVSLCWEAKALVPVMSRGRPLATWPAVPAVVPLLRVITPIIVRPTTLCLCIGFAWSDSTFVVCERGRFCSCVYARFVT